MNEFVTSILEDRKPMVDIVTALNMTVAGIVAHHSALKGGELMKYRSLQPFSSRHSRARPQQRQVGCGKKSWQVSHSESANILRDSGQILRSLRMTTCQKNCRTR